MEISIGADPEIFLVHKKTRKNTSAHDLIPGDKKNPHKVKCGAIQVDGTAAEFNIEPAFTAEQFATNLDTVLKELRSFIPDELEFNFSPVVHYGKEYFATLPDCSKELGCDPDFDAFNNGEPNPRPNPIGTMRTGSGHIHIGWTKNADIKDMDHRKDCIEVVRNLDYFFQNFIPMWDTDTTRKKMYGNNGAFRYKPYGVEYRTLSNAWLNNPDLWPWIFNSARFVVHMMTKGYGTSAWFYSFSVTDASYVRTCDYNYRKLPELEFKRKWLSNQFERNRLTEKEIAMLIPPDSVLNGWNIPPYI